MNAAMIEVLINAIAKLEHGDEQAVNGSDNKDPEISGWKIVVLDRGFVAVGKVSVGGDYITISDCGHFRRWGTDRGLGQLHNGPLEETIIDRCGEIVVHKLCVIHIIDVDNESWGRAEF